MPYAIEAGSKLGRYEIIRTLGMGGAGSVFLARDTDTDERVALKSLMAHTLEVESVHSRFIREISIAQKLKHPNLIEYLDCGFDGDWLFYTMEFVPWGSLADVLARKGCLPWKDAIECSMQLCDGLHYMHSNGVIHRDLKPGNIFLSDDGQLKIGDFGLARDLQSTRLTQAGHTVGTAKYLSPDQARGVEDIDGRADLYALGCMMFEMLAGQTPFEDVNDPTRNTFGRLIRRHIEKPAPIVSQFAQNCPQELSIFVDRLLKKDRAKRPDTAEQASNELSLILNAEMDTVSEDDPVVNSTLTERLAEGTAESHNVNWQMVGFICVALIVLVLVMAQLSN